jgi:hypothetical protein
MSAIEIRSPSRRGARPEKPDTIDRDPDADETVAA